MTLQKKNVNIHDNFQKLKTQLDAMLQPIVNETIHMAHLGPILQPLTLIPHCHIPIPHNADNLKFLLKEPLWSSDKHRVWMLTYSPTFISGLEPLYQSFRPSIIHSASRIAISELTFPFPHFLFCTADLETQES